MFHCPWALHAMKAFLHEGAKYPCLGRACMGVCHARKRVRLKGAVDQSWKGAVPVQEHARLLMCGPQPALRHVPTVKNFCVWHQTRQADRCITDLGGCGYGMCMRAQAAPSRRRWKRAPRLWCGPGCSCLCYRLAAVWVSAIYLLICHWGLQQSGTSHVCAVSAISCCLTFCAHLPCPDLDLATCGTLLSCLSWGHRHRGWLCKRLGAALYQRWRKA